MFLTELFDRPYKWKITHSADDAVVGTFQNVKGNTFRLEFMKHMLEEPYPLTAEWKEILKELEKRGIEKDEDYDEFLVWGFTFSEESKQGYVKVEPTGGGDQYRVYSTVWNFLRTVIAEHNVQAFVFSAGHPDMVPLYTRFVPRIQKALGWSKVYTYFGVGQQWLFLK